MMFSNWFKNRKKEIQRKEKIRTAKKVIFGAAAGSLSGIIGGLLFSPKSGKETRKDIANSSKELKNNIKEKSTVLKGHIDNKVSDAKDGLIDAKAKISEYLNEKKAISQDTVSEVIDETKDTVEDISAIIGQADVSDKKSKK
ncbi:YtxH domain-containing protein [Clostridium estertheticum]|uniref:YtxH domain-containing protein n=1 Tax=Clostridium estertheticum TaxID=238834 RepID=UPI001C0BF3A5|nr:YtxH domain-containing protein [Clostridium estertheticum]MBU3073374.1 YtxH domain-containing protein [Clostridium estertheticum]MBU3163385.1 YtxH domain-containing protein [Clostridium estertheticum]